MRKVTVSCFAVGLLLVGCYLDVRSHVLTAPAAPRIYSIGLWFLGGVLLVIVIARIPSAYGLLALLAVGSLASGGHLALHTVCMIPPDSTIVDPLVPFGGIVLVGVCVMVLRKGGELCDFVKRCSKKQKVKGMTPLLIGLSLAGIIAGMPSIGFALFSMMYFGYAAMPQTVILFFKIGFLAFAAVTILCSVVLWLQSLALGVEKGGEAGPVQQSVTEPSAGDFGARSGKIRHGHLY